MAYDINLYSIADVIASILYYQNRNGNMCFNFENIIQNVGIDTLRQWIAIGVPTGNQNRMKILQEWCGLYNLGAVDPYANQVELRRPKNEVLKVYEKLNNAINS